MMLQQVMTAPGEIEFREVPVPEPEENQVLVKIRKIGVCGSDIHVYHGEHPFTSYPVTQAVSYTHLDVYKRQWYDGAGAQFLVVQA